MKNDLCGLCERVGRDWIYGIRVCAKWETLKLQLYPAKSLQEELHSRPPSFIDNIINALLPHILIQIVPLMRYRYMQYSTTIYSNLAEYSTA